MTGLVIPAWPSFALIAAYELLMRQVRRSADAGASHLQNAVPRTGNTPRARWLGWPAAPGPSAVGADGPRVRRNYHLCGKMQEAVA